MTVQKYKTNLNCGRCVAAVKPHLDSDPSINRWSVDTADPNKVLTVEGEGLSVEAVERHVTSAGFRVLGQLAPTAPVDSVGGDKAKSFLATYRPLLLILAYLIGLVGLAEFMAGGFDWMRAMGNFMGGFFVAFSYFKLLDLRGFADSFQTYDIVARSVRVYALAYPFIELGLGVAYFLRFAPLATNLITLALMLIGIVGVSWALLQKRKIQCACLGTVFNLPMSKVTFIEDAWMAAMAGAMLVALAN
jgi:hypothetical protein